MSEDYTTFLKSKVKIHENSGFDIELDKLNKNLFDWQKVIVQWALKKGKCALFEDCGLGKGLQALDWATKISEKENAKVLILAPLAVTHQLIAEAKKFNINSVGNYGTDNNIQISNYEQLHNIDTTQFIGIVLDESSILKHFEGKRRTQLIDTFQNYKYKLCCSATPSPNDYSELGNHVEFLNIMSRVEMLSTFFVNDQTHTGDWRLKGHGVVKFWEFVSTWSITIQTPQQLGFKCDYKLPKLTIKPIILQSKKANDDMLFALPEKGFSNVRKAKKDSLKDRIDKVKEIVESTEEQFLIWCEMNEEGDLLEKSIKDSVQVAGSDKDEHKIKSLLGFANNEVKRLITKPKIGGFGMNWQSCHNIIFCGLSFSYESFYQSIRRCWRFGQNNDVNVYIVLSERELTSLEAVQKKERLHINMLEKVIKNVKQVNYEIDINKEYEVKMEKKMGFYKIYNADCIDIVRKLEDESVDLSIFSPPFADLFTYSKHERDMGNSFGDEEFFKHFDFLIPELNRIMKSGRLVAVHCMLLPYMKFKDGFIGLKDFRGDIIRLFQKYDFVYHSEVTIWKDPVTAMQRTKALGLLYHRFCSDSSVSRQGIPDYLCVFRKRGEPKEKIIHDPNLFPVEIWQKWASPVWMDINQSNTLQKDSCRNEDDEKHICPLQLDVIERAINLWSNKGDIVFSPFGGIGSEGYKSIQMDRKFIGVELKKEYYDQMKANLDMAIEQKKQLSLLEI